MKRHVIIAAVMVLPGCSAVNAVTSLAAMPVRAASKAVDAGGTLVDAATTSQSERDEKRGRELRLEEERLGALEREYHRQSARCDAGEVRACDQRDAAWQDLQALMQRRPDPAE